MTMRTGSDRIRIGIGADFLKSAIKLQVPYEAGNFLASWRLLASHFGCVMCVISSNPFLNAVVPTIRG
jgi:hypothetical protein